MRAIWKGSIAFGLVHIPVNLYPATESQSISSNLLHKKGHSRIRYQRVSEAAGKAYALLRKALAKSGKVGVAQFVLRNRESLCVLKAQGNALTLNTLRFAS